MTRLSISTAPTASSRLAKFLPTRRFLSRYDALLIGIAFAILYMATATRGYTVGGVVESDSMELQRAAVYLGIAHSPGYPLYTILAHLFSRLGSLLGVNPFTAVTYFSSFTMALAVALLYRMLRLWFRRPAALVASCIFGLSGMVWHLATIAEVQGLHLVIVISILYLFALYLRSGKKFVYVEAIALMTGLGLANHRTTILPALVVMAALALDWLRRQIRLNAWEVLRIAAMGLAPLFLYFYVIYEAAGQNLYGQVTQMELATSYQHLQSPYNVIQHILGYGQTGLIVFPVTVPDLLSRFTFVLGQLSDAVTPLGILVGVVGLALFIRKDRNFGWVVLGFGIVEYGFVMAWRAEKAAVYVTPIVLILSIGAAALADVVIRIPRLGLLRNLKSPAQWRDYAPRASVLVAVVPVLLFATGLPLNNRSQDTSGQAIFENYLCMAPGSTVFTDGYGPDHFIGLEAQRVTDKLTLNPTDNWKDAIQAAANKQGPVYIAPAAQRQWGILDGLTILPDGGLALSATTSDFLQARTHDDPTLLAEAMQANPVRQSVVPGIDLFSYQAQRTADGMQFVLYWQATMDITTIYKPYAHLRQVDGAGKILALLSQRDYPNPVKNLYPTTYWKKGEVIRDTYFIPWPKSPSPLPSADSMRWSFGFTAATGERLGEVNLPFDVQTEANSNLCP